MKCRNYRHLIVITIVLAFLSCKKPQEKLIEERISQEDTTAIIKTKKKDWREHWENVTEKEKLLNDPNVHDRIKETLRDSNCTVLTGMFMHNYERFTKVKNLGDLNKDGVNDSVMVVPQARLLPDKSLVEGCVVLFTDPDLPNIYEDLTTINADDFFSIADIDEDGIIEIGQYKTSGVSRYKGLYVLSVKNRVWKEEGAVTFDIYYDGPSKEERIQKSGKSKFKMLEITDGDFGKKSTHWLDFEINQ